MKVGAAPDTILRFHSSERVLHWAIAVPFTVCYTTAVILVIVYNPDPDRPFRAVFSWTHRVSGICLLVLPLLALAKYRRDYRILLYNVRQAWIWSFADLKWLALMGPASISSRITLPYQGKFNAAEKMNFMVVMTTWPLYIVTGLMIWLPGVAFLSWVAHVSMAAVATPLLLGHIFMATVNPGTRVGLQGMISGFVDRQWAKHHYRLWYDEAIGDVPAEAAGRPGAGRPSETATTPEGILAPDATCIPETAAVAEGVLDPDTTCASQTDAAAEAAGGAMRLAPPMIPPAVIHCPSCQGLSEAPSWGSLRQTLLAAEPLRCSLCAEPIRVLTMIAAPGATGSILRALEPMDVWEPAAEAALGRDLAMASEARSRA